MTKTLKKVVIVFSIISGFYQISTAQSNLRTFTAPNSEFQVQVPQNWTEEKSNSSILILNDPALKGRQFNFLKYKYEFNESMSIEAVAKDILKSFKKGKNSNGDQLNSSNFITMNNLKWWFIDYTSNQGTRYKSYQTIANSTKYSIYYICPEAAFEEGVSLAENVVASFGFNVSADTKNTLPVSSDQENKNNTQQKTATGSIQLKESGSNKQVSKTPVMFADAGAIAATSIKLEIDGTALTDFNCGIAPVYSKKMREGAFMNSRGKFITPFGKYYVDATNNNPNLSTVFFNNYVPVRKTDKDALWGVIDTAGNEVVKFQYRFIRAVAEDGYCFGQTYTENRVNGKLNSSANDYYIGTGKKPSFLVEQWKNDKITYTPQYPFQVIFSSNQQMASVLSEGIIVFAKKNNTNRGVQYGYMNREGKILISPVFDEAHGFSEGLAKVAKHDETLGTLKWGFINKSGKLVIPCMFTNEPGNFHEGLAKVIPASKDDMEWGYINKQGEVVIKIKSTAAYSYRDADFQCIYSPQVNYAYFPSDGGSSILSPVIERTNLAVASSAEPAESLADGSIDLGRENVVILADGSILSLTAGIRKIYEDAVFVDFYGKHQIIFGTKNKSDKIVYGVYQLDGKLVFPPIFSSLGRQDPVSGLSRASIKRNDQLINGYINKEGVFVMVVADDSKW